METKKPDRFLKMNFMSFSHFKYIFALLSYYLSEGFPEINLDKYKD